ncbi:MAG: cobalamin-dependent protein [bacterium]
MKLLFIYPDVLNYALFKGSFYSGIASISAVLNEHIPGININLLHITKLVKQNYFLDKIEQYKPDLIAFSSTANMYPYVKQWSNWIKSFKNIGIICGGVHPTLCPDEVIGNENIDFICRGDGELSMVDFCRKFINGNDVAATEGIWTKKKTVAS